MRKLISKILLIFIILTLLCATAVPITKSYGASYNQKTIDVNSSNKNGIEAFPNSYKVLLNRLVSNTGHTNWKFKAFYTDIDWNELVSNETDHLHNTIYIGHPASWYDSCWKQGDMNYYCASKEITSYYMDPRNFLTEISIFQFLDLSYDSSMTPAQIQTAVKGTYLDASYNGETYAQIICEAAKQSGESAFSIMTRIFQELGRGSSTPYMISGRDSSYPNTYNFYNYGASDGSGNISRGLKYAYNAGWRDPKTALIEGAKLIAGTYTKAGQVNKYLYKFDVVGNTKSNLYSHQYMTNVEDPNNQANILYGRYNNNNFVDKSLTFVIPVFKNMPAYIKLPPNSETNNLYYISSNYTDVGFRDANQNSIKYKTGAWQEVGRLAKDAVVSMKQKDATTMFGLPFSKVSYNGIVGYVATMYLSSINNTNDSYSVPTTSTSTGSTYTRPVGKQYLGSTKDSKALISYSGQIEDIGWTKWAKDGETLGTTGEERRLETVKIELGSALSDLKLQYRTHVEDIGWMNWVNNGEASGTEGKSKRVEAIEIKLNNYDNYDIKYRVHVQDIGWMDWKSNGETAGTTGKAKRIETIEIKLVSKKTETTAKSVKYVTHVQDMGWLNWQTSGATSGTTGLFRRVEAIKIELTGLNTEVKNAIQYRTHVQDIGWMDWKYDGVLSGTEGQSKRVEAIEIKLNEKIKQKIKYRVHVQDIGWMDWKSNGETAGTTGQSKRIEAIEIKLE